MKLAVKSVLIHYKTLCTQSAGTRSSQLTMRTVCVCVCLLANMANILAIEYSHIQQTQTNISMNLESCFRPLDKYASADHFQIFWECPHRLPLGRCCKRDQVNNQFRARFQFWCYFGNSLKKQDRYLQQILIAGGKKAITRKWLSKESPTIFEWIETVQEIYVMDGLTFSLRHKTKKYEKCWKNWKAYLNLK